MEVAAAVDTHSTIIVVVTIAWLLHMVTWYDAHMQARTATRCMQAHTASGHPFPCVQPQGRRVTGGGGGSGLAPIK